MTRFLCSLALLAGAASACADRPAESTRSQTVAGARCPVFPGYLAEVEVTLGGLTHHGRIIVTHDGDIHLEHLDEPTTRWVHQILRQELVPAQGWDDRLLRAGPVRRVWGRLGQHVVLTAIHTPDISLKVSRHQLLSER